MKVKVTLHTLCGCTRELEHDFAGGRNIDVPIFRNWDTKAVLEPFNCTPTRIRSFAYYSRDNGMYHFREIA